MTMKPFLFNVGPVLALLLAVSLLRAGPLAAQEAGGVPTAVPDAPGAEDPVRRDRPARDDQGRYNQISESTFRQIQSGEGAIHIYQLVEEMIDEVVADVSKLNASVISPAAVRNVSLTPNLSAQFGDIVEGTLISALSNNTQLTMKRCAACRALRSRVEDDTWVVSLGLTRQEDLVREASNLGALTYLDARLSFFPGANIVALQVEIFRARDGAILWTETYRSDASTAAILRSGDRVMSRAERLKELERKIDARPYYGHILYGGAAYIPYDSPLGGISGASLGYRLYEKFGENRRFLFGVGGEAFANLGGNALLGSFISGTLQWEIFEANLNDPTYRTGPTIGGFVAGTEGNSFFAEWGLDIIMQFRLGAGVSVFYFMPVEFDSSDLGGMGAKGRISFNW
ncbi:MAG: hypothetical protein H0U74_17215 [Bradymonadaceae bacterium]|nr:hypothetical protein [Lujinxingiaceae bacterium]